ncbi:hypothetical protein BV20DRAFT_514660 [Pilatotrama ljubarskyi]|nr:hypothetical protein BV20DRAFT_514660 [Pilatotrama ljubarskyi]
MTLAACIRSCPVQNNHTSRSALGPQVRDLPPCCKLGWWPRWESHRHEGCFLAGTKDHSLSDYIYMWIQVLKLLMTPTASEGASPQNSCDSIYPEPSWATRHRE